MSNTTIPRVSRVDKARQRLERAISEVETAIESGAGRADAAEAARALDEARADNTQLREANETISQRLDEAINRLRAVLEG